MSAAEAERNPVLQLIEQFSEWERTLDCEAFFTQKIFPLSARALRRLLTSQDDALLLVLNNMQSHGNALTYICRCSVVMLVKALGFDGNPTFSSDLRLFVKLLLRHVDLLCNSTKNMCACFDSMCKNLLAAAENRRQLDAHTLEAMLSDVGAVAGILGVFLRLLQEARSATPIRAMASILGCLLVYYGAAFAVIYEGAVPSGHSLQAELLKVMQTTAIIAERIMATLPADCVDDDTARSFIPTESFAHVNTSLSSSSRLSHHQPPWPTDTPIRDILPGLLSKKIIFNDQYVLSVLNETGSSGVTKAVCTVCGPLSLPHLISMQHCLDVNISIIHFSAPLFARKHTNLLALCYVSTSVNLLSCVFLRSDVLIVSGI